MIPVVELEGLRVDLGGRKILHELTATLEGRAIGLLGPNGAGKTTLIHTLLGFHPARSGTARVLGDDIRHDHERLRTRVGYMPENESFIAGFSAVRFLMLMAEISGLPHREALESAHDALELVGVGEARYRSVETLSQGMKQRVKLAQALVHGPELIILDEPTNGLDPAARQRMVDQIAEIAGSSGAHLILSSHLLPDVEQVCDRVLILKEGHVASVHDLEAERKAPQQLLEIELRGEADGLVDALADAGCECAVVAPGRLKVVLPESLSIQDVYREAHRRGLQLRRLQPKQTSLEEIFLEAMQQERAGGRPR
jgi:ABC-2 type transport system ATP-binding protein